MKEKNTRSKRRPTFLESMVPIIAMLVILTLGKGVMGYSTEPLLIMVACVAAFVAFRVGVTWDEMLEEISNKIAKGMPAILILISVGALVGTWMASGTIPLMIYYGIQIVNPQWMLVTSFLITAVVSVVTGTSWGSVATMGVALMGISGALGVSLPATAGACIAGSYLGDKISPLSDTTNLAAGVSNTGLFDHVTAMVSTTGPTFLIALVLYTILGLNVDSSSYDPAVAQELCDAFAGSFNITPLVLIPLVVVILMCILRVPGLVGIAVSVATAILFSLIFQLDYVWTDGHTIGNVFDLLHYGMYTVETGNEVVDSILGKAHGMDGTMWTINLVLLAVAYGGALERCGSIERIFGGLKHKLNSVGSLVVATMVTSIFCDATMCDQFLGIGVPAPLYVDKYDELGLGRNMLSRTLEDAGTLWAVMFPWTGCGAYQQGVLGMSSFVFFPYAFVNLLNPIYAYVTAMLGRNIFWADGSYTNLFGKTKAGKPAGAPAEAHEKALAALEARRAAGKAPKINA